MVNVDFSIIMIMGIFIGTIVVPNAPKMAIHQSNVIFSK
jgi:hypothetical protein